MTSAPIHIAGSQISTPDGLVAGTITVVGDSIQSVVSAASAQGFGVIDGTGLIAAPGFIDLQINGGFGIDLCSDPGSLWDLGRQLPRHGVTGFLPTIITAPPETYAAAFSALDRRPHGYVGAEPLGLHFEGPMLNPERRGAHLVDHLVNPSLEVIEGWSRDDGLAMVTLAPELPQAVAVISELARRGVVVAAGHTDANTASARAGLAAGVRAVTHLFNSMAPFGHRSPNLIGVALAEPGLIVGLIVDGVHVDPVVVAATWNAKGPTGVALVSDAVAAMGQGPGTYELAGTTITADVTGVRNRDGALAGSLLTMDLAVRNLVSYTGCESHLAVMAATATPAGLIGQTRRGRLEANAAADLVLLDENLDVQITLCSGRIAYATKEASRRVPADLMEVV